MESICELKERLSLVQEIVLSTEAQPDIINEKIAKKHDHALSEIYRVADLNTDLNSCYIAK